MSLPLHQYLLALSLLTLIIPTIFAQVDYGLLCSDHPSPLRPPSGPLIRSWEYKGDQRAANIISGRAIYHPRYTELPYYPISEGITSTRYRNLDLFFIFGRHRNNGDLADLHFQRPARVYMFVNVSPGFYRRHRNAVPELTVDGWSPLGWAKFDSSGRVGATIRVTYGLHQESRLAATREMMVFQKDTESVDVPNSGTPAYVVTLPNTATMARSVTVNGDSAPVVGFYHVRVAEIDGTESNVPTDFGGVQVQHNQPCPPEMHAAWDVPDDNAANDRFTQGLMFGSWHPMWDPCYWCSYGHEHGSSARFLMDYKPKYGLTQYKFVEMFNEPNPGFKDFVIPLEDQDLYLYVSVHIQTSMLGRVTNPNHTATIVVKTISTGILLMEMSFKNDFGFISARGRRANSFIPLTPEGAQMQRDQETGADRRRRFRSVNVIDVDNLDDRFRFIRPDPLVGTYEEWVMSPPCSRFGRRGEMIFDVLDPITGIRTFESMDRVELGRKVNREPMRRMHTSLRRTIRSTSIELSAANCEMEGLTSAQFIDMLRANGGHFYSDPFMRRVESGAGPNNVKQFIDPDFMARFQGSHKPDGMWLGPHKVNGRVFFSDHGFGTDTSMN